MPLPVLSVDRGVSGVEMKTIGNHIARFKNIYLRKTDKK